MPCIFCQIISGEAPSHKVWESESHMAFLSIFPNTEGVTVVVPKEHYPSYVFNMPELAFMSLIAAAKEVGLLLDAKLDDVGRTAMVAEGFGVDHAHIKLFPMHGTKGDWVPRHSDINTYYETYPGYISTHDSDKADDSALAGLAKKIKE
jgi:diadenosine tetraphosphate (Ap4A) HIT family hydrolase